MKKVLLICLLLNSICCCAEGLGSGIPGYSAPPLGSGIPGYSAPPLGSGLLGRYGNQSAYSQSNYNRNTNRNYDNYNTHYNQINYDNYSWHILYSNRRQRLISTNPDNGMVFVYHVRFQEAGHSGHSAI